MRSLVSQLQVELPRSGGPMGERGIGIAHTTILRWVQYYFPEFEKRWNRLAGPSAGRGGWMKRTSESRGAWMYLYLAVDKGGKTIDFYLSRKRDVKAAKAFCARR